MFKVADYVLWTLSPSTVNMWYNGWTCLETSSSRTSNYYGCVVVQHQTQSVMDCGESTPSAAISACVVVAAAHTGW